MTIKINKDPAAMPCKPRWESLRTHKRIITRVKLWWSGQQGGAKEHAQRRNRGR